MALRKFRIKIDGKLFEAEVEEIGGSAPAVLQQHPVQQHRLQHRSPLLFPDPAMP